MDRDTAITNRIYDLSKTKKSSNGDVIMCFSAYMEKYNKDFKYSSRYINSHIKDFERIIEYNNKFELKCEKVKSSLCKNKIINEFLSSINNNHANMGLQIDINKAIRLKTQKSDNGIPLETIRLDVLDKDYIDKFKNKSKIFMDIIIRFSYDDIDVTQHYHELGFKTDFVDLFNSFINEALIRVIKSKGKYSFIELMKNVKRFLPKGYNIEVNLGNDFWIVNTFLDNYFKVSVSKFYRC